MSPITNSENDQCKYLFLHKMSMFFLLGLVAYLIYKYGGDICLGNRRIGGNLYNVITPNRWLRVPNLCVIFIIGMFIPITLSVLMYTKLKKKCLQNNNQQSNTVSYAYQT